MVEMQSPGGTTKASGSSVSQQALGQSSVSKKKHRRRQVRLAQRAYLARNEAQTGELKQRVARLESSLERTSQAIISFTDTVIETRVLSSHHHLAYRLRDSIETCLNSALHGDECPGDNNKSNPLEKIPTTDSSAGSGQQICAEGGNSSNAYTSLNMLPRSPLLPFLPDGATVIEAPAFVDRLRMTCLYQGFLLLNNPSVSLEALRRPFRLLLSLVTRDTITSYFHACLYARLNNRQPGRCSSIPCFQLGGAGTHYLDVMATDQTDCGFEEQDPPIIYNALSAFSPEAQEELDGEWFDIVDLMGYLQARRLNLSMAPPIDDTIYRTVNVINFTAALIEKGICLGHSPGSSAATSKSQ